MQVSKWFTFETFEGYKATANTNFLEDMEKKKEAYLEGKDFDSDEII